MKIITTAALTVLLALSMLAPATADTERYQFTTIEIVDADANDAANYYPHFYTVTHNPCTDTWTDVTSYYTVGEDGPVVDETLTNISLSADGTQLTFTSTYPNGYTYTATVNLDAGGTISLAEADAESGVNSMGGTYTLSRSSYNHGEYVAENKDDYGTAAHSCIGKPVASNDKASR